MTWLDQFFRDVKFGVRNLAKSPGFTATAVISLALGIMATTAIYSVLHAVVLDPFPYKDVDNLMSVRVRMPPSAVPGPAIPSISISRSRSGTRSSTAPLRRRSATSSGPGRETRSGCAGITDRSTRST